MSYVTTSTAFTAAPKPRYNALQVKPFRKLRKVHNQGKRTRLRDLIRYDMRQMHAAFTGTLPVGSKAENSLGGAQASSVQSPATVDSHSCSVTAIATCMHACMTGMTGYSDCMSGDLGAAWLVLAAPYSMKHAG